MKKLIIAVAISIIVVTTMLVNFVGAAMLEIANDQWVPVTGSWVEDDDGMLGFGRIHTGYEYTIPEANRTTEGSYEIDFSIAGEDNWMSFGKGIGAERDLVIIHTYGGPNLAFERAYTDINYYEDTLDLEYGVTYKIAISYVFDEGTQILTQTVYINGEAVATDVTYDFTGLVEAGSKFDRLTLDAANTKMGNVKWSSDPKAFPSTGEEISEDPSSSETSQDLSSESEDPSSSETSQDLPSESEDSQKANMRTGIIVIAIIVIIGAAVAMYFFVIKPKA